MPDATNSPSSSSSSSSAGNAPAVVSGSSQNSDSLPSGDELKQAIKTIRPVEDFKALPTKPCTRESLLYGLGTGTAMGGIRMLSARVPVAANWAVGTFIFVSGVSMFICSKAREEEHRTAQAIIKKFPERNIRLAQKRAAEAQARANEATAPSAPNEGRLGKTDDTLSQGAPGRFTAAVDTHGVQQQSQGSTGTSSWWSWASGSK